MAVNSVLRGASLKACSFWCRAQAGKPRVMLGTGERDRKGPFTQAIFVAALALFVAPKLQPAAVSLRF